MWMLIAIVLLTAGGSFGDDDCLNLETCPTLVSSDVHNLNAENLLNFCQVVQDMLQCLLERGKECGLLKNQTGQVEYPLNYLKNICKPDSDIYRVISNDIDCVKDNVFRTCESDEELRKALKLVKTQSGGELHHTCETAIVLSVCKPAMMAEDCEEHVGEAVQEVIVNLVLPSNCGEYVANIVRDAIETMHVAQFIEKVEAEFYE